MFESSLSGIARRLPRLALYVTLGVGLGACSTPPPRPVPPTTPTPAASVAPNAATDSPLAAAPLPTGPLATRIDAFIGAARFRHAAWGIEVVNLATGRTLYEHRADEFFVPASNAKLYTAALALATLEPDARFHTDLYTTARTRADGILAGNLILAGGGDPSLGDAAVAPANGDWATRLAAGLAALGITRVEGDLIADDTYFQGSAFGRGWEVDDLATWYAPPASALSLGGNVVALNVVRQGMRCCRVTIDPAWAPVGVRNLTGAAAVGEPLSIGRAPGADTFYALGSLAPGQDQRRIVMAAPDPALLAAHALAVALSDRGISLHGRIRVVHWPEASVVTPMARRLARIASPPLRDLVRHMLKTSDNLYAQVLLQDVGVATAASAVCADRATAPRSSAGWGLCALRTLLMRAGIAHQANFSEGSGLSRHDLVTPHATVRLLAWVRQQSFAADFMAALPIAGVDGTLRNRLRGTRAENNLAAKTGTLSHVYALSGYVTDVGGAPLAFALYLNRYLRPQAATGEAVPSPRADLDAVATMLANLGQSSAPATHEPHRP